MSIPRIILGLAVIIGSACTQSDSNVEFRGEEHVTSDSGDTDKTTGDEHDTDKTTGDVGTSDTGEHKGCARTQGYWKNHNIYETNNNQMIPWPISEDTELCGRTWLYWLNAPPRGGDAFIILAHQWIAAMLNQASGADVPTEVQDALDEGGALLNDCTIAAEDRDEAIDLADTLDDFNNGLLGTPSCDADEGDDDD